MRPFLVAAMALVGCAPKAPPQPAARCGPQPDGSAVFGVLHVNDVYRIEGLADGSGGLARLATLRRDLSATCPDLLLTHGGDALSPSLLSNRYAGEHMVDVLNRLDGDAEGFDRRMFAVFGNHEFDRRRWKDAAGLDARLEQSGFTWLDTSIEWRVPEGAVEPAIAAPSLADDALVELGGVRVGLFGLTLDKVVPEFATIDSDPVALARRKVEELRGRGAQVVIGLTHLQANDDLRVLDLGDAGPDLVLGGHDHGAMALERGGRWALKGDADAISAQLAWIRVADRVSVEHQRVVLDDHVPPDAAVAASVEGWMRRFDAESCGDTPGCLSEVYARAAVTLRAEELELRRFETNFGNWLTDLMRRALPEADVALLNSGSVRLNQDVPEGVAITRRMVEETFPFPLPLKLLRLDGATLRAVVEHAATDWTGSGHWLQTSGLAWRFDPQTGVRDLSLLARDGARPLRDDDRLRVAVIDYVLDRGGDQDGFTMLGPELVVPAHGDGSALKELVVAALRAAGDAGIAPQVEGRICHPDRPGPCLAVSAAP